MTVSYRIDHPPAPAKPADSPKLTDREKLVNVAAVVTPGQRFDAAESDRALALRLWVAMGRSLDERAGAGRPAFRDDCDAYVITRVICTAERMPVARRDETITTGAATGAQVSPTDAAREAARVTNYNLGRARSQLQREQPGKYVPVDEVIELARTMPAPPEYLTAAECAAAAKGR